MFSRWWHYPVFTLIALSIFVILLHVLAAIIVYPNLPSLDALTDYKPKIPLRIYTADGALIGEYGEERRALVKINAVPKTLIQAILAAEDDRFYQHGGVDYLGILRAAWSNFLAGEAREGASTITMQVARNFFLSREKTFTRKLSEALLSFKIENNLTKDQILELYLNQIYLGQRAYGFSTAAQTYFGKPLEKISLSEAAMLAGLPKAPSRFNPIVNPKRAKSRQAYVLRRMLHLGYINEAQYSTALQEPIKVSREQHIYEVSADYIAEMVRQELFNRYHDTIYSSGYRVYTTLKKADQEAANQALRQGVLDYDKRHGYRGPEDFQELPRQSELSEDKLDEALTEVDDIRGLIPAIVLSATPKKIKAYTKHGETITFQDDSLQFVSKHLSEKVNSNTRIRRGSIIRIRKNNDEKWEITQIPEVESALIALDPRTGAIKALVGGFDYTRNKFNHVVQAWRQPGSSFKPFIYSAALEKGFTAASVINDAPLSFDAGNGQVWEPKNFDNTYSGPIRLREALTKSKNLVSIRILRSIGVQYAQDYIARFGFDAKQHPPYLPMALGAGSVTPLQMAEAYSVFANGGYRISSYFIDRITDARGTVLFQASPPHAEQGAERVIDPRNAFIMTSMMQDVIERGTATRAMQLKRQDLAGKTGTTNDQVDAWFAGYNPGLVAVAWMGFDKPRSLGSRETGAQAALPIWISYMSKALNGVREQILEIPPGIASLNINSATGLRLNEVYPGMREYFYQENIPPEQTEFVESPIPTSPQEEIGNQLF